MKNLLEKISINDGHFPRKELKEIIARKDEYIPELLEIAVNVRDNYEKYMDNENYIGHIYAFFLLAQFRVKEFYPIFIDILKLPDDVVDYLLGVFLTEHANRVLTSLYEREEDIFPLKELIEGETQNQFVPGQAMRALVGLVLMDKLDREYVVNYFEQLMKKSLESSINDSVYTTELVCALTDLYPDQSYNIIKRAYEKGFVDEWIIGLEDVDHTLNIGKEQALADTKKYNRSPIIEDMIKEMQSWVCFHKEKRNKNDSNLNIDDLMDFMGSISRNKPVVNKTKVGRNEPCPCGSGKKYKRCCG